MKSPKRYGRILAPFSLLLLAACQTVSLEDTTTTDKAKAASTAAAPEASSSPPMQATAQGAPVAVFLAARQIQAGWTPVPAPSGTLYVNPKPFLTRSDLREVKAGGTEQGQGWLALSLNPGGAQKVRDVTASNPSKGLALVIGRTMMPLMLYNAPITDGQLVFYISNKENAIAAARAIAGVRPDTNAAAPAVPAPVQD